MGMVATYPSQGALALVPHVCRRHRSAERGLAAICWLPRKTMPGRLAGRAWSLWSDVLFTRAHAFYENHGYLRRGGLRALGNPAGSIEAGYAKPLAGRVVEQLDIAAAESAERAAGRPAASLRGKRAAPSLPCAARAETGRGLTGAASRARSGRARCWRSRPGGTASWPGRRSSGWPCPRMAGTGPSCAWLMVAPGSRCRGLARRLLEAAEAAARADGRRLLVMQTRQDEHAAPFYREAGWMEAGYAPGYFAGEDGQADGMSLWLKPL